MERLGGGSQDCLVQGPLSQSEMLLTPQWHLVGPGAQRWAKLWRVSGCLKTPPSPSARPTRPANLSSDTRTHRPWAPPLPLASKPAPAEGSALSPVPLPPRGSSWAYLSLERGFALIRESWSLPGRAGGGAALCSWNQQGPSGTHGDTA